MKAKYFILVALVLVDIASTMAQSRFVTVKGTQFELDGQPYYYIGANYWYGMNLGSTGKSGDRDRLKAELDQLEELGVKNLRICAATEGPDTEPLRITPALQTGPGEYNDDLWTGLDFFLDEMKKRDMKAIVVLNNMWPWSGGFAQYLNWAGKGEIPYPPPMEGGSWTKYQKFTSKVYNNDECISMMNAHIEKVVNRKNGINGVVYKEDPTIMAWELCNEPRGIVKVKHYLNWIKSTSAFIKSLDQNHLVTIGSEGKTSAPKFSGVRFDEAHLCENIDYTCIHIWVENWNWYNPEKPESIEEAVEKAKSYLDEHLLLAEKMNKPMVLEEFGIARDNRSYDPADPVLVRDKYYNTMLGYVSELATEGRGVSGANFWAYAGSGRPKAPYGSMWDHGNSFIGDPPHEHQGWYSIYDHDKSTLEIIGSWASKMSSLSKE